MINKIFLHVKVLVYSCFALCMSFIIKRNPEYVAFGSWCGEIYSDNPKYLADYMEKHYPNLKIIWVGKKEIKDQIPQSYVFEELDSFRSIFTLLQCKYFVCMQNARPDICSYNVFRRASIVFLDHGIPVKKWAMSAVDYKGQLEYKNFSLFKKFYTNVEGENNTFDYITISSDKAEDIYRESLAYRIGKETKIIKTGTPRNDYLINCSAEERDRIKRKIAERFGFDSNKTIIGYYPTYRRKSNHIFSFLHLTPEQQQQLGNCLRRHNAILLEKGHFVALKQKNGSENSTVDVINIEKDIDFQQLLLSTDIQIADYSGGFLDYCLLDRPIIQFVYDYEDYKTYDSGLYYTLDEFAAGAIAVTYDEVMLELENILNGCDSYQDRRKNVRNTILKYEDGHACEKICKEIFANVN